MSVEDLESLAVKMMAKTQKRQKQAERLKSEQSERKKVHRPETAPIHSKCRHSPDSNHLRSSLKKSPSASSPHRASFYDDNCQPHEHAFIKVYQEPQWDDSRRERKKKHRRPATGDDVASKVLDSATKLAHDAKEFLKEVRELSEKKAHSEASSPAKAD